MTTTTPVPGVSGGVGAEPAGADAVRVTESAFYYIAGPPDTCRTVEGTLPVSVGSADSASVASTPLSAWLSGGDAASAADAPARAWQAGDDTSRAVDGYKPFRFALADPAVAAEVMHEMGIWTYIPVGVRLEGRFWTITGLDEGGNEVVLLEAERLDPAVRELAERLSLPRPSWARPVRVRLLSSAETASLAEGAGSRWRWSAGCSPPWRCW